jgi:hypothetical protein
MRGRTIGLTTAEATPEPGATPDPEDEPLSALLAAAGARRAAKAARGAGGARRRAGAGGGSDGGSDGGARGSPEGEDDDRSAWWLCRGGAARADVGVWRDTDVGGKVLTGGGRLRNQEFGSGDEHSAISQWRL